MKLGISLLFAALLILMAFYYEIQFSTYPYILTTSTRRLITNQTLLPTKVVLIVIDALCYDYYQRMPVFSKITANYPQNSFVVKTKVGSPTMTTQRIQSLMTGSEIFSSSNILKTFLASKTDIDNIISQLNIYNKTSMVFGDDTWVKLFDFTNCKICSQTFDVHDYETCDKLIYRFLSQKIYGKGDDVSYDFLVGHFLALDHIGHATSSLTDKIMDVKMKEISAFLEQITDKMEDGTMVLVTGDHGMRDDGNHGGSSVEQTETFFFGYLKGIELYKKQKRKIVSQGDITATLSILLNIPIPSNTVGYPIIQAFPRETVDNKNILISINQQIYQHFLTIFNFYSVPIDSQQKLDIEASVASKDPQKLQELLENVSSRLQFLNYSSPNPQKAILNLVFLSLVTFSIIIYSFFRQLKSILISDIFHSGLILTILTLFCVNFSWFLIQQLSNVLSLVFIGIVFISIFKANYTLGKYSFKIISFILTMICYCLLAQIQPKKINDYATGFLRIATISQICNNKILIALISSLSILVYFRAIVRKIRKNRLTNKQQSSQWHEYLKLLVVLLSYINYISTYYSNQSFYLLRTCLCFLIIVWFLLSKTNMHSIFLIVNFLSLFLGQAGPIILLTCYYIELNCSSLKIYPIIMSILAESAWWWMGNRYEYSGIDVVKSYIFCAKYIPFLNAICLLIYLLSPYLLVFSMINYPLCQESISRNSAAAEKMEHTQNQVEQHQSLKSAHPLQNANNSKQKTYQQSINQIQTVNLQFISLFLLGLLSCAWNVHYNNEKILFTVVYVPMLLFCTIKCVGLISITVLTTKCMKYKQEEWERQK